MPTGRPPFETNDPLELVHWHIARTPAAPGILNPRVPAWLSQITMKLLAKMAEDRYQSASGLLADLERVDPSGANSAGVTISLGADDGAERFAPPQRLYGRDREIAELTAAFERAAAGETVFAFVGGYAGVGKTAVVAELGKAVLARRGRFVAGKFEQLERGRPYAALFQALGGLCRQVDAEGGSRRDEIEGTRARAVVDAVEAHLVTPLGLRSLAPSERDYRASYGGSMRDRDSAYHQGTVWPWLIGPFVDAWIRVRGGTAGVREEARRRFIAPLEAHLRAGGLGHVSEVASAESPHDIGGGPFQAWSLGELLRVERISSRTVPR